MKQSEASNSRGNFQTSFHGSRLPPPEWRETRQPFGFGQGRSISFSMPDDNGGLLRPNSAHALSKSSSDIPSQIEVKPRSESYPNGDIAPPNTARMSKRDSNGTIGSTTTSLSYVEFRVTPPSEHVDRRRLFQQRDGSGQSFGGFTNSGSRGELARAKSLRAE